ncbi:MAG TPA: hypothetical protein VFG50_10030 [Rhodothermales bacterium]|nr:hypothetical protein [Rhodothermales bacterium]
MGVSDTVSDLAKEVAAVFKQLITLGVQVEGLDKDLDRIRGDQRNFFEDTRSEIRELRSDFRDLQRRITTLEGLMQSSYQNALKEALVQIAREHLDEHGTLDTFNPGRLLSPSPSSREGLSGDPASVPPKTTA